VLQVTQRNLYVFSYLSSAVLTNTVDVPTTLHNITNITAQRAMLTISEQYLTISKLIVTTVFLYKLTLTLLWYTISLK